MLTRRLALAGHLVRPQGLLPPGRLPPHRLDHHLHLHLTLHLDLVQRQLDAQHPHKSSRPSASPSTSPSSSPSHLVVPLALFSSLLHLSLAFIVSAGTERLVDRALERVWNSRLGPFCCFSLFGDCSESYKSVRAFFLRA